MVYVQVDKIHVIRVIEGGKGMAKRICVKIMSEIFLNLVNYNFKKLSPKYKVLKDIIIKLLKDGDKEKILKVIEIKDKLRTEKQR